MDWSDEQIEHVRRRWLEGASTATIGRELGVSKNAVIGKARRLDLPERGSPIVYGMSPEERDRRQREREQRRWTTAVRKTYAPLPALPSVAAAPKPIIVAPPPPPPAPVYGRVVECCWPIGEPGTPTFRFCEAASMPAKPYCEEHAKLAYVKVRDRREDDDAPTPPLGGRLSAGMAPKRWVGAA